MLDSMLTQISGGTLNRRHFLKLAAFAGLAAQTGCSTFGAGSPRGCLKKGIGISAKKSGWEARIRALRAKWSYSWGASKLNTHPAGVDFTPMIWTYRSKESFEQEIAAAKATGSRNLLPFNEPDQAKQGNMTVDAVLEQWSRLQETGLRLGSPGCVHPDKQWMIDFMVRADALKYRVDFVCVHSYGGPNVAALVKRLTQVHEMFGRPLWITEFGVGDWKAKSVEEHKHSAATVLAFMKECLPALDELKFLERYAWFPAPTKSASLGTSALFNPDDSLTPLGEFYAAQ
jgi:hypothetical protein